MNTTFSFRLLTAGLLFTAGCGTEASDCQDGFARDKNGRCAPVSDTGLSGNTPPTAPSLRLTPPAARAGGDDLHCRIETPSADVDGEPVNYRISWTRNGAAESADADSHGLSGNVIAGDRLAEGDRWDCQATPSDGESEGPGGTVGLEIGPPYSGFSEQIIDLGSSDYILEGESDGGDCLGGTVGYAGDVDDDGKDDIFVSDYWWDHPERGRDAGKTYLFLGKDLGASQRISISDAAYSFVGEWGKLEDDPDCEGIADENDRCGADWSGHSLSGGMDGDGDGLDDLLICSYRSDTGAYNRGKAHFFSGSQLGAPGEFEVSDDDFTIFGGVDGGIMGHSILWAGDVDGDGMADIAAGAHAAEGYGHGYLISSSSIASGTDLQLPRDAAYTWIGENDGDDAGKLNSAAGDIDGDGLSDFVFTALRNQEGGSADDPDDERRGAGKAYVIRGGDIASVPQGTTMSFSDVTLAWYGEEGGSALGYGVELVGDFDGDGLSDILAGAFGTSINGEASGKSYVVTGNDMRTDGLRSLSEASYGFVGEGFMDWSGFATGSAGDFDSDGLDDVIIGALGHTDGDKEVAGRAYLFLAGNTDPGTHLNQNADHIFAGERAWDGAGYKAISPGDVNGDGLVDLMISAWQGDAPDGAPGKVHILLNP